MNLLIQFPMVNNEMLSERVSVRKAQLKRLGLDLKARPFKKAQENFLEVRKKIKCERSVSLRM